MTLELYHLQGCPYCRKVRDYIEGRGMRPEVQYHEVSEEPGAADRVEALTGDSKVPVLVVDGKPIAGSNVIIEWLQAHGLEEAPGRRRDEAAQQAKAGDA
jgi:glutaredoxin 3